MHHGGECRSSSIYISIIFPYPHVQVGIGAGVPIASIYLREISTPELRGTLTILMPAAANTGNLVRRL